MGSTTDRRKHRIDQLVHGPVRVTEGAVRNANLSLIVDDEDLPSGQSNLGVRLDVRVAIAKAGIVGKVRGRKEGPNARECRQLEDVGALRNHLVVQRGEQAVGRHEDGALGQCVLGLPQRRDVATRSLCMADGPRREVQQLVVVRCNRLVEASDAGVGPVSPQRRQDVPHDVGSGDRPVNVRNDNLGVAVPQVETGRHLLHPLQRRPHGKLQRVAPRLEVHGNEHLLRRPHILGVPTRRAAALLSLTAYAAGAASVTLVAGPRGRAIILVRPVATA
mmetsp:Transcript_2560/g.8161  ORF Transcript_2560/g.8161 Transcript_2560/m.8161 type:complete len:276 (+) Transcript_2560:337-1164(+)